MFHGAEVVETIKAYKTGQRDEQGRPLFNGSVLVRVGGGENALGQVKNLWCAPATFNKRIPLIGEQVLIFEAAGTEQSATNLKQKRYYYFTPYNTVNDVTSHQFPTQWNRQGGGKTTTKGQVLADKKEVGYTIDKRARGIQMLQPFEGDDLWEGRFGQSIRFSRAYDSVNGAGKNIYQEDSSRYYPGKRAYDPLMILKVKKPKQGTNYDIEDLSSDTSSIYLTTSHKLLKFVTALKSTVCDVKEIPNWDKGGQIMIDSDRVVINAKNDIAFFLGRTKSIISAQKVILKSQKFHVDIDELMKWLNSLASEIGKLATAQATFTTFMGPTGVASNSAQFTKIAKADFKKYFLKSGCGGNPASKDSGNKNSTKGQKASNSLAASAAPVSNNVKKVFNGGAPPASSPSPSSSEPLGAQINEGVVKGANWVEVAFNYIASKERFHSKPYWDFNAYRAGYGTSKMFDPKTGKIRKVEPGDVVTKADADRMLKYQIETDFYKAVVGSGDKKISKAEFDKLSDTQKAALVSYAYNTGGLRKSIASEIKAGDMDGAAAAIAAGPKTATDTRTGVRKELTGLVKRRNEEAALFKRGK